MTLIGVINYYRESAHRRRVIIIPIGGNIIVIIMKWPPSWQKSSYDAQSKRGTINVAPILFSWPVDNLPENIILSVSFGDDAAYFGIRSLALDEMAA